VSATQATDTTQYPYWIQSTQRWTSQRLSAGTNGTLAVTSDMVIFPQYAVNQATPFWSNYFNAWMLVHGTGFPTSQVMVMTAPKLEEPCTDSAGLAVTCTPNVTRGSTGYAITGHPEYESRARRSS
jgi:hypothetical protein